MSDTKISDLTELNEAPVGDDIVPMVDLSATTTKKIRVSNLGEYWIVVSPTAPSNPRVNLLWVDTS